MRLSPRAVVIASLVLVLPGCASLIGGGSNLPKPEAIAQLTDSTGQDRGRVDLFRDGTGLRLEIVARGFNPGSYGMHVHSVGRCDAPGYVSAGAHWNPTGVQHGRDNPMGAHHGDMPNLLIEPGLIGRASVTIPAASLGGATGLLDADGATFILHAAPDDLKSDPSGNSGARIVCGVFAATRR